jgi:propanediol dehydratase small subunit
MSEFHPEWKHVKAMREKLLADMAIEQALREGYSKIDDIEIEAEIIRMEEERDES